MGLNNTAELCLVNRIVMEALQTCIDSNQHTNTHIHTLLWVCRIWQWSFSALWGKIEVLQHSVTVLMWPHLPCFSFVFQHSRGLLFPLRQLHGNRLGDFCAGTGLLPKNVFRLCCPWNPHWTHLGSCIQTHYVWEKLDLLCAWVCVCACVGVCVCESLSSYLNSLTHLLVSETLWSEKDSFAGVWYDDNLCVPSLWPGWRPQTVRWVHTHTGTFMFWTFLGLFLFFKPCFLCTNRNHVHPVCWNRDVSLHPSQLVTCHTDTHAADTAYSSLHVWSVNSLKSPVELILKSCKVLYL